MKKKKKSEEKKPAAEAAAAKKLEEEKRKEAEKKLIEIEKEEKRKKEAEGEKGETGEGGGEDVVSFSSEQVVTFLFDDILANRFGEDWILKEKELKSLSKATDDLLLAYAEWLAKHSAKINFGLCLFMIIKPRIESAKKRREIEREKIGKEKK